MPRRRVQLVGRKILLSKFEFGTVWTHAKAVAADLLEWLRGFHFVA